MTESRSGERGASKPHRATTQIQNWPITLLEQEISQLSSLCVVDKGCFEDDPLCLSASRLQCICSFLHIHHFVLLHMSAASSYKCPAISRLLKCRGCAHCVPTPGDHHSCNYQPRKCIYIHPTGSLASRSVGVLGNSSWKACPT